MKRLSILALTLLLVPTVAAQDPADEFLDNLKALCGQAFEGEVLFAREGLTTFDDQQLVMHVRQCEEDAVYIPFHVGDDRSRTWVITRTEEGLRLKHDHRHEDGSEEDLTQYGGDTAAPGTAQKQEFPADEYTARMLPPAASNVWTVEVIPGETFVYALRRDDGPRVRVAFDLAHPIDPPPAPWGWE